ncbi:MAG: DUF2793 domain-containing protein [Caenispirillum bisanense]|nr:DUF2793 domain-containing protein [Caenispirillum bisanense]
MSSIMHTPSVLMRSTTLGQNLKLRESVSDLQSRIAKLTEQQTSGFWASSHGELRSQSTLVQGLRQKMSTLDSYLRTIGQVQTRIEAQQGAADVLQKAADGLGIYAMSALNTDAEVQLRQVPLEAYGALERIITSLNTNIEGRYLFSGADTQTRPVQDLDTILNGKSGKMGLKDAAANRLLADLGGPIDDATNPPDGRVTVSRTGTRVSVVHDGGAFGLKLKSASFSSGSIQPTAPTTGVERTATGSRLDVDFGTVVNGDQMMLTFQLPTGETMDVTMRAVTSRSAVPPDGVVEFEVDDDMAITSANFVNALRDRVTEIARSDLAGASGVAAANDFFDFYPPRIVAGTDPANATAHEISGAKAIEWYDGPRGPRPTAGSTVLGDFGGMAQGDGTSLPTPPAIGQRYFVDPATEASAGAGAWAGHPNEYAVWDGAAWSFSAPAIGERMVSGENFGTPGQLVQWDGANWNTVVGPAVQDGDRVVVGAGARAAEEGQVLEFDAGTSTWSVATDQPTTVLDTSGNRVGHFNGIDWDWTAAEDGYEMVIGSGTSAVLYEVDSGFWTPRGTPIEDPADPRDTMKAKIDDSTWVSYGARANEDALREALKNTAILAAVEFDADMVEHYHALTSRAAPDLKGSAASVVDVRTAIGVSQNRLQVTLDRHEDVRSLTEQQTLRIEKIDEYKVAVELNQLMTQLQGTYSITAKVQQLSLVNFL